MNALHFIGGATGVISFRESHLQLREVMQYPALRTCRFFLHTNILRLFFVFRFCQRSIPSYKNDMPRLYCRLLTMAPNRKNRLRKFLYTQWWITPAVC